MDSTAGKSRTCFSLTSSFYVHRRMTISSRAYSTTSREVDGERDGRHDRDFNLCTKLGADLDTIRAAFVRTIRTLTRGVSDPARRACADPDAREAGSSRLSLPSFLSSEGGPAGKKRRPTETQTTAQVPAAVWLRNQWVRRGDDRPCVAVVTISMVDGAGGQLGIVPPPRPPSCRDLAADASFQGKREESL